MDVWLSLSWVQPLWEVEEVTWPWEELEAA